MLSFAKLLRDLDAAHLWQHDIQQNKVEALCGGNFQSSFPVAGHTDRTHLFSQALAQQAGHFGLVFYDQHMHGGFFRHDDISTYVNDSLSAGYGSASTRTFSRSR